MKSRVFEWLGVITAIFYSLLVAANIGAEFIGFSLLLTSSALIGIWAYIGKHRGILFLQFFLRSSRNHWNGSLVLNPQGKRTRKSLWLLVVEYV